MNERYIIVGGSEKNVMLDNGVQCFEFRARIPYYEGVPLSQIAFVKIALDNQPVNVEDMVYFPGLMIAITVVAFNLFGNGLRDALDPRLK